MFSSTKDEWDELSLQIYAISTTSMYPSKIILQVEDFNLAVI